MKIHLQRKNEAIHFEGSSELVDVKVNIDGSESIGGEAYLIFPAC
ncbi:putative redox protein [Parapedobacter composti]|uniref:Putative redox protein n=1 Tax=Parapedobacter composti TaxID=623281 RepID=A0A1I1KE06_9SPHI|nr:putative redox protein [Parapedobacter composti]